jgi:hypothetical protein
VNWTFNRLLSLMLPYGKDQTDYDHNSTAT